MKQIKLMVSKYYNRMMMSDEERYLSKAVDHADLEYRIKTLRFRGRF